MQRRRTGGVVGKAQRLGDTGAIIVPPFGNGTIATVATQHRTTDQREHGRQGMAFARQWRKSGISAKTSMRGCGCAIITVRLKTGFWFMRDVPGKQGPMWNKTL